MHNILIFSPTKFLSVYTDWFESDVCLIPRDNNFYKNLPIQTKFRGYFWYIHQNFLVLNFKTLSWAFSWSGFLRGCPDLEGSKNVFFLIALGVGPLKFWKNHFFYWLKKLFEPSRIRDKRYTRPTSCSLKFRYSGAPKYSETPTCDKSLPDRRVQHNDLLFNFELL